MNTKELVSLSLISSVLSYAVFLGVEAPVAQATSATDGFDVSLSVSGEISVACPDTSVTLSSISGLTGGETSPSHETCTVITNNASGYTLSAHASTAPALQKNGSVYFEDHTQTQSYSFTSSTVSSTFGFTVSSTDAVTAFKNNGSACGAGSNSDYFHCFRGFNGTSDIDVATKSTATGLNGMPTDLSFKAKVGSAKSQETGSYTTTVTVTAVTNP